MKFKEVELFFEEEKHSVIVPPSAVDKVGEFFPVISVKSSFIFLPSYRKLADYFESLYYLIASGTSLSTAFLVLFKGNKNKVLKGMSVVGYVNTVSGENPFKDFDRYMQDKTPSRILEVGQATGRLVQAIKEAVSYLKEIGETKGELLKKLFYPTLVFFLSVGISLFASLYAIPNLQKSGLYAFVKNDETVRLALKVIEEYAKVVPFLIAFLFFAFISFLTLFAASVKFQEAVMKIPLLNSIFFKGYYVGFRAVSSGLKVGMSLSKAFKVAQEIVHPEAIRKEFALARKRIEEGEEFSSAFSILSDVERTMIANAVKSEFLVESFSLLSDRMKGLYRTRIKMIPPVVYTVALILGISTALGLIGSVIVPYLKMIKGLSQ